MNHHPIHQPDATPPTAADPARAGELDVGRQLADLTPAQQAELQTLVTRAVTIATTQHLDSATPHDSQVERSPLAEPGVWIVIVMLALVAVVAIVALAAVFGLSVIGA